MAHSVKRGKKQIINLLQQIIFIFQQIEDFNLETELYLKKLEEFVKNKSEINAKTLNLLTGLTKGTGDLISTCKVSTTHNQAAEENLAVFEGKHKGVFEYQNLVTCRVCHVSLITINHVLINEIFI